MLSLNNVIERLRAAEGEFGRRGVTHLAVFGSVARGEATADSDIDLLIDIDPAYPFSVIELAELKGRSEDLLATAVDVVPNDSLRESLRESVDRDAVRVF